VLLRPQLVLLPAAVFLWKRQWRALAGLSISGAIAAVLSLAVVGVGGIQAYLLTLTEDLEHPAQFARRPELMHTWWGFLDLALGGQMGAIGHALQFVGIAAAIAATIRICWGVWDPSGERFSLQWAALILATVFTSPYLLVHDLAVLLVPGFLLARAAGRLPAGDVRATWLRGLLVAGYGACWITLFLVQAIPIQVSVVFEVLALAVLVGIIGVRVERLRLVAGWPPPGLPGRARST
jgi:hypothetical protein